MDNATAVAVPEAGRKLNTYTPKERNMYLLGMVGQNIIYNIVGSALAYYLQFTLLIPAMAVTVIMAVARVWDAMNDPMMGTIVDKTRSKWGKCRPYLIYVPLPIFIITTLCFVNFGFYRDGQTALNVLIIAWAAFTYILWGMTYTVGDIPLWGVTALMTEDEKDRNKLLSLARIFGGIGAGVTLLAIQPFALAIGGAITEKIGVNLAGTVEAWEAIKATAAANTEAFAAGLEAGLPYESLTKYLIVDETLAEATRQGERWGFLIAAVIFGIVGCALFQLVGPNIKERVPASEKSNSLKENFKLMWNNNPFRQILLSGILSSPKMLLQISAMPLITYYFASKSPVLALVYMALLGGGMFLGQFVAMALCPKLLTKFSKKNLYNYSSLLGIIPFVFLYIAYVSDPTGLVNWYWIVIFFFVFAVAGASMGVTTVLQSFMIADCVDYEEYKSGIRPDGVFFSGQTFIAKLTSGIATIMSGIFYTIYGFSDAAVEKVNNYISAGLEPRTISEFDPYMRVLFVIVSLPPAVGCLLAVIPTWKYCLDDDEHKRILEELSARRAAKLAAEALGGEGAIAEESAPETGGEG